VTRYLERLFAGEEPSAGEWNDHLVEFHRTVDDVMFAFTSLLRTPVGETSYEHLARRLSETSPSARAVLDVGSGDGSLLCAIESRFGDAVSLHGVDLSERDVEAARARLPHADLRVGDVASIDYAPETFDAIDGHLSFRAIANLRDALATLRRALKPSGALLVALEEPWANANLAQLFGAGFEAVRKHHAQFAAITPASETLRDEQEITDVLRSAGFAGPISTELVSVAGDLDEVQASLVVERAYYFGLLARPERNSIREHVMRILELQRSPNGLVTIEFPMRLTHARVA
jgi:ubiquinone/menaquinone biosynthesis C-methylase UbiE